METIDKSCGTFGANEYKASNTLFEKVKKDVALSKAVSIMKRSQGSKGQSSSSSKEEGHDFSWALLAMYGNRQGKNSYLYPPQSLQWRKYNKGGAVGHSVTPGARCATTETTTGRSESTSTEVLKLLNSLPASNLKWE